VVIARQDKSPLYLVTTNEGKTGILIFDTDSEYTKKIKEFMAMYGIVDIKMRMLKVQELKKIQGFPDNYILKGSQTHQKKFIGNSVVPVVIKKWSEALVIRLRENNEYQIAV
jgi:DNA (cytosine-5)-methyltransferase 1